MATGTAIERVLFYWKREQTTAVEVDMRTEDVKKHMVAEMHASLITFIK